MGTGEVALLIAVISGLTSLAVAFVSARNSAREKGLEVNQQKDENIDQQEAAIRKELRDDRAAEREENKALKVANRELEKHNRLLQIQNEELQRKNELLEVEVATLRAERAQHRNEIENLKADVIDLNRKVSRLENGGK